MKAHSTSKATITGAFLFATFVIHVNGSHVRDTNVCKYSDMLVNILKRKSDHLYNCSSVKRLPQRPALSILFKPDDITSTTFEEENSAPEIPSRLKRRSASNFLRSSFSVISEHLDDIVKEVVFDEHSAAPTSPKRPDAEVTSLDGAPELASLEATTGNTTTTPQPKTEKSTKRTFDLPDSFAPLLSSSQTEMLLHHLTADLIHGFHAEAGVKMQPGRHEIPLDMNQSRPQFVLNVPKEG